MEATIEGTTGAIQVEATEETTAAINWGGCIRGKDNSSHPGGGISLGEACTTSAIQVDRGNKRRGSSSGHSGGASRRGEDSSHSGGGNKRGDNSRHLVEATKDTAATIQVHGGSKRGDNNSHPGGGNQRGAIAAIQVEIAKETAAAIQVETTAQSEGRQQQP